jgi:uncharacterized protein YkwD
MKKQWMVLLSAGMLMTACSTNTMDTLEINGTITEIETSGAEQNISEDTDASGESDDLGKSDQTEEGIEGIEDSEQTTDEEDAKQEEKSLEDLVELAALKESKADEKKSAKMDAVEAAAGGSDTSTERTASRTASEKQEESDEAAASTETAREAATPTTAAAATPTTAAREATSTTAAREVTSTTAAREVTPTTAAQAAVTSTTAAQAAVTPTTAAASKTVDHLECSYSETAYVGDTMDPSKLVVKAVYTDGTSETVKNWTCSSFVFQLGYNNLTVVYGNFTQYTYLMAVNRPTTVSASTFVNGTHVYVQDYDTLGKKYNKQFAAEINKQLNQINAYRKSAGASALTLDATLCNIAGYRIAEIELDNTYSHTHLVNLVDTGVFCPAEVASLYGTTVWAENISQGTGSISTDSLGVFFAEAFYNSSGHRANMENASYTKVGIAISYDGYTFRCVQVFQ